jgi:RNA polymerase sigma-54 factor
MASQLLQVPGADLEQLIWCELANNPALELVNDSQWSYANFARDGSRDLTLDRPESEIENAVEQVAAWPSALVNDSQWSYANFAHDRSRDLTSDRPESEIENAVEQVAAWPSAIDQLEAQVRLMATGPNLDVAVYLLHSLNERGYLTTGTQEIAVDLGTSIEVVEQGLQVLHQLDPPGIGARDLRECLLIQCTYLEAEGTECQPARYILTEAWEDFLHQRWSRVARQLNLLVGEVEAACQFMVQNLCPYPLGMVVTTSPSQEVLRQPDLLIQRELQDNQSVFQLEIPAAEVWELRISGCFAAASRAEAAAELALSDAEEAWIKRHFERARLFIAALSQRWATLRRIGQYLIDYQVEFLEYGPGHLRPLTRAAVARALGLHESTVSRATSEKTIQLPHGQLIPLSDLFDKSLPTKAALHQLLARAGKPLSDRELGDLLQAQGIKLARRTVAKYRQQLDIPPSYYRKHGHALSQGAR